jgi:hypothetical protein
MRQIAAWMIALTASVAMAQAPVKTESGDLTGTRSGNVRTFLGVPFAAPPVGELRWKAPQPVTRSTATLPADKPGPACTQVLSRSHLPWTEAFMVQNNTSEDCLSVNLWVPARGTKHAVLVFFHGGAFTEGSNSIATYDGTTLAEHGIIVVDANYRLGIFGRVRPRQCRQLRPGRPDRSAGLGAAQHRRIRWRSGARHHCGPVRRCAECGQTDWIAAGEGVICGGHHEQRTAGVARDRNHQAS